MPQLSGQDNPAGKLVNWQIKEIRYLWSTGKVSKYLLSKVYGVSIQTIGKIIRNEIYKNV